jgi:NADH-quinone oxidoreductase subunit E
MLSEQEKQAILDELNRYPQARAAVPDALRIVQASRGWVSDEGLEDIAGLLGLSADEIEGVATFSNLIFRRPVGRHVILLCDSISCWIMGYTTLLEHLRNRLGIGLGETTSDGRFTLLPANCLGACDQAPVMMVDEDLHGQLTPEKADRILEGYR